MTGNELVQSGTEWLCEYRKGGYHPVYLKDVFNQRYKVVGKLAYGWSSTVWLAADLQLQRQQVALKNFKADKSKYNKELSIIRRLSSADVDHPGKKHIVELLDHLKYEGPNGTHLCLVFPAMVSNGQEMVYMRHSRSIEHVRIVSEKIMLGLDFLHEQGIVHCDLQPVNVLFSVSGIEDNQEFLDSPYSRHVEEGRRDAGVPMYCMVPQRRRAELDEVDASKLVIKIGRLSQNKRQTWKRR